MYKYIFVIITFAFGVISCDKENASVEHEMKALDTLAELMQGSEIAAFACFDMNTLEHQGYPSLGTSDCFLTNDCSRIIVYTGRYIPKMITFRTSSTDTFYIDITYQRDDSEIGKSQYFELSHLTRGNSLIVGDFLKLSYPYTTTSRKDIEFLPMDEFKISNCFDGIKVSPYTEYLKYSKSNDHISPRFVRLPRI